MRTPQEIPERVVQILKGLAQLGLTVTEPEDHGMEPLLAIHDAGYLQYLETAHAIWKKTGPDWGDEVISNIFVRSPNALRGILAQTARYLADGSCPVGPDTWISSYWAAQAAVAAAKAVLAGDQQAALFGQGAIHPGDAKCTYGTGAFVLLNTGDKPAISEWGLLSTLAWQHPSGERVYALEGSVFVAGAAVQWLRDGLGIIETAAEVEALAASVPDTGGVSFVPSFTGLGAPFWNPDARGLLHGITRGTNKAHIARATLEGIAFQVSLVVESMCKDAKIEISRLRVDGGAAANNLLMQIQSDQLQATIERAEILESTAFGVGLMAGLGCGLWESVNDVSSLNRVQSRFTPEPTDQDARTRWLHALATLAPED
jgi:glycerol kinase